MKKILFSLVIILFASAAFGMESQYVLTNSQNSNKQLVSCKFSHDLNIAKFVYSDDSIVLYDTSGRKLREITDVNEQALIMQAYPASAFYESNLNYNSYIRDDWSAGDFNKSFKNKSNTDYNYKNFGFENKINIDYDLTKYSDYCKKNLNSIKLNKIIDYDRTLYLRANIYLAREIIDYFVNLLDSDSDDEFLLHHPELIPYNPPAQNRSNQSQAPRIGSAIKKQIKTSNETIFCEVQDGDAFEEEVECLICQETLERKEINLSCGHDYMHLACLAQWMESKKEATCPMCRKKIVKEKN